VALVKEALHFLNPKFAQQPAGRYRWVIEHSLAWIARYEGRDHVHSFQLFCSET
jgi:hypothetical protein